MSRRFQPTLGFREDLRQQIFWYRHEVHAPEPVIDGLLTALDEATERLLLWPESGRSEPGEVAGLQATNLPKPYGSFVLLYVVHEDRINGLRLIHSSRDRPHGRQAGRWH